jgi:enterochelin esterase-like enzyme
MKVIYWMLLVLPEFGLSQALSEKDTRISVGRTAVIHSTILSEDRGLWVYVPDSFPKGSPKKYPVMYLLDWPSFFHSVTAILQYLRSIDKIPEMIVVGLSNTNSVRDFFPIHSIQWSNSKYDTAYTTTSYRILVRHFLGGLTDLFPLLSW